MDDSASVEVIGLSLGPKGEGRPPGTLSIPRLLFGRMGVDSSLLRWHQVDGDAMAPTLRDGDVVVVELGEAPRDGGVHVVALPGGGVAVRRTRSRLAGGWTITCDNPVIGDRETSPALAVIGVVVLRIGVP